MRKPRRIGLYGGTFDPIHRGHIETVLAEMPEMLWDEVIFIPAHQQPFKQNRTATSPYHRFAMATLATDTQQALRVSDIELLRGEVSYTIATLRAIRSADGDAAIDWIVGEDNLALLPEWKSAGELFDLANFVVLRRGDEVAIPASLAPRVSTAADRGAAGSLVIARNRRVDVSATDIRRRVAAGEQIDSLVHPAVARYIAKYRLYHSEV